MATPTDSSRLLARDASGSPSEVAGVPAQVPGHSSRRVLVCLDGSALAETCLPYALFFSKTFGGAVTLMRVLQTRNEASAPGSGPQSTDAIGWEIARREAAEYLEGVEKRAAALSGQSVDVRLEQGHPAERITALARELGAGVTVLGSHGEGGVAAWTLGSTVQQVMAVAGSSILLVRSPAHGPGVASPERILVPLDGSLRAESILPTAVRIAAAQGGELILAHVVAEPEPTGVLRSDDLVFARQLAARLESRAQQYLGDIREKLTKDGAKVRAIVIRHVDGPRGLLELAAREGVDFAVVSAHGATCNAARAFGNVTAHLLQECVVPLLVLQDLVAPDVKGAGAAETRAPSLRASFAPGVS